MRIGVHAPREVQQRRPLMLYEVDKARLTVLNDVGGETVVTGFALPAAEFDDHAPKARKMIDSVGWEGS